MQSLVPALLFLVTSATASAPVVPSGELAPFLRVITSSAGAPGRIACRDIDLAMALKKEGLSPDAKSPVAWAASTGQLKAYLAEGKLVVGGEQAMLAEGAGIVIVKEKGKPAILVSLKNVAASGVTLSDALLKISRVN